MVLKWLLSHGLEKKHQVSSSINRSQKTQITKNNERNRKRIVSNPRKEAVTTNSQWFTWWFSFEAVFLNIRKLLVLYLLLPQSEAVVERSFFIYEDDNDRQKNKFGFRKFGSTQTFVSETNLFMLKKQIILLKFGSLAVAGEYSWKKFKFPVKAVEMKEVFSICVNNCYCQCSIM